MKQISLLNAVNQIPRSGLKLGIVFLSMAIATAAASNLPALAANRVVQVLGKCGSASAQYLGNRKHGNTELISFQPSGDAGIVIEGLEGKTISELQTIFIAFEPPEILGTYTFVLRIKVAGEQSDKIQNFTIGPDSNPNVPNLPTDTDGDTQSVNISSLDLVGGKSKLTGNEVVRKVSFLFSSAKVSKQTLFIDDVRYAGFPVYLLLEPVTCNLK